ncbi:CopG family ribbon-helix-helix protein [Methylophilus aquaticus]|uniref:CopG family transcriptional regulator n=1 Tax=Methylophilus aquaticus TaxID=1971610 RepID=A0ABT9JUH6_9PROT|nr:CopG family transcriptional regulator [Methylophilus aquaticus]MDP8568246.1 CopG family transcriptional regulator [Methylophilus aquaticus]
MSNTVTIRLEESTKIKLEKLAASTHRTRSFLAAEAIKAYVESNEWQINEIKQAISEAEAGDFATQAEVDAVAEKWRTK